MSELFIFAENIHQKMITMRKRTIGVLWVILLCFPLFLSAQNETVIKIEELSKPEHLLPLVSSQAKVGQEMLFVNVDADSLVDYGFHPFFYGMYEAYAHHRPFVLSPDMIWLLISQGFSHHINAYPEKYRDRLVDFSDKMSLVVISDLPLELARWDSLIPQFAEQIKENTKGNIAEMLIADFSTTTEYERIASEITLMETTKNFFEFVVISFICGIPEVTLKGTTADWQKVYDRTFQLRSFDLDWWVDELQPILFQFVEASKGNVDVDFWRNMFKWHTLEIYGNPNLIDGWIVKFFPYDKDGKRFDLKNLTRDSNLPDEIARAEVRFIETTGEFSNETTIELCGGFIGLAQDPGSFSLTPKIGWWVRKVDKEKEEQIALDEMAENLQNGGFAPLKVRAIPELLNKFDTIKELNLKFIDSVYFPDWMKDKKIDVLRVRGDISASERRKLIEWYPVVEINHTGFWKDKSGALFVVVDSNIGNCLDGVDHIGKLYINNYHYKRVRKNWRQVKDRMIEIPDGVIRQIDVICFSNKPSRKCLRTIREQFPNTEIQYK